MRTPKRTLSSANSGQYYRHIRTGSSANRTARVISPVVKTRGRPCVAFAPVTTVATKRYPRGLLFSSGPVRVNEHVTVTVVVDRLVPRYDTGAFAQVPGNATNRPLFATAVYKRRTNEININTRPCTRRDDDTRRRYCV